VTPHLDVAEIEEILQSIDAAWLTGNPEELHGLFHQSINMVFPGFSGRVVGREALIEGFREFCSTAIVHDYRTSEREVDVVDDTAVASFRFEMVYEREGVKYKSIGRDFWVFAGGSERWKAVWRTMLDVNEEPVTE
jgi:hypothetical protein